MTNMCCEVNSKYFTLFQVCGVNVELRIGIVDDWKVDCTDSQFENWESKLPHGTKMDETG